MNSLEQTYRRVVIVGGGPVGLYLALFLRRHNIDCIVLEKKESRNTHSRSLGIHPVALELMDEIGIVNSFLGEGVKILEGIAFDGTVEIGRLNFRSCPGPYRFVLSLPQFRTEAILEAHLEDQAPGTLIRGTEVASIEKQPGSILVNVQEGDKMVSIQSDLLVGCDGKESFVRRAAGFAFHGKVYPDTYLMGDFTDHTDHHSQALIYLCRDGLIESFPLPNGKRRWVIKTGRIIKQPDRHDIEQLVEKRIGCRLHDQEHEMVSGFGVQKYVANPIAEGRIFLAGDSAHIVSPIGGQGMNLGWLDARCLAGLLIDPQHKQARDIPSIAKRYNQIRTATAKKAIRRGELNMRLGRKSRWSFGRNKLVWIMLNTPLRHTMARVFTMRGLE